MATHKEKLAIVTIPLQLCDFFLTLISTTEENQIKISKTTEIKMKGVKLRTRINC